MSSALSQNRSTTREDTSPVLHTDAFQGWVWCRCRQQCEAQKCEDVGARTSRRPGKRKPGNGHRFLFDTSIGGS